MDTSIFVSNENLRDFWLGIQPIIKKMVPDISMVYINNMSPEEAGETTPYSLWVKLSEDGPELNYKDPATDEWAPIATGGGSGGSTFMGVPVLEAVSPEYQVVSATSNEPIRLNFKWFWDNGIDEPSTRMRGYVKIYINNIQRYDKYNKLQNAGTFADKDFDLRPFLRTGQNNISIEVTDIYGKTTTSPLNFTIEVLELSLTVKYFNSTTVIFYSKNPAYYDLTVDLMGGTGIAKRVWAQIDGDDEPFFAGDDYKGSPESITIRLTKRPHGVHKLRIYAEAQLDNATNEPVIVAAEPLILEIPWCDDTAEDGTSEGTEPLIFSSFKPVGLTQYERFKIPFCVYDPRAQIAKVSFEINDKPAGDSSEVERGILAEWPVSSPVAGKNTFTIRCRDAIKTIEIDLAEVTGVDVPFDTNRLITHFKAEGKTSNKSASREEWTVSDEARKHALDTELKPEFYNFSWEADGWFQEDDRPSLRLTDGSYIIIPYSFFSSEYTTLSDGTTITKTPRDYGATLELDFKLSNVLDTSKTFFSCFFNDIGIQITPQMAKIRTNNKELTTRFSYDADNDSIKLAFVINPYEETVLSDGTAVGSGTILIYINGIASGCTSYTYTDGLLHIIPNDGLKEKTYIKISSVDEDGNSICTVDLYNIRLYAKALSDTSILNNWIHDKDNLSVRAALKADNDIFVNNQISYENLVHKIPCMTIISETLPQHKGDKIDGVTINFSYSPPGSEKNKYDFELKNAQLDIQGTSSQYYPLKNWKFKSEYKDANKNKVKSKFYFPATNTSEYTYAIDDSVNPSTVFCLKIDFMESSGTHNTVTANLANTMYDADKKTPPQQLLDDPQTEEDEGKKIRTTIFGRPILVFHRKPNDDTLTFCGKFNFNYDKDAEEIFGFIEDPSYEVIECIEFKNNTSSRCLLHESEYKNPVKAEGADLEEDYTDKNSGMMPAWRNDFEVRYQYRGNNDYSVPHKYLKAVTDWLVEVDQTPVIQDDYEPVPLKKEYITNSSIAEYLYRPGEGTVFGKTYFDQNGNEFTVSGGSLGYTNNDVVKFRDANGKIRKAVNIGLLDDPSKYEFDLDYFLDYEEIITPKDGEPYTVKNNYYAIKIDEADTKEEPNEIFKFALDTRTYRLARFKTELKEHFNEHYVLMYYILTDLLAMIDSRTKNMFWATWGERFRDSDPNSKQDHSDPTKDNVVIWYPIFYDMDTMMGVSNTGIMDIPHYVEYDTQHMPFSEDAIENSTKGYYNAHTGTFHKTHVDNSWGEEVPVDKTNPDHLYYDLDTEFYYFYRNINGPYDAEVNYQFIKYESTVGYLFNGASNVLWNNVEDAYGTELRALFARKTAAGAPLDRNIVYNAYTEHSKNWCAAIYNEDGKTKFIKPYTKGYVGATANSNKKDILTFPDYLYALQGDRALHRKYWLNSRYDFLFSKHSVNDFMDSYIVMRIHTPNESNLAVAPNAGFTITTDLSQYASVKFGSKTVKNFCTQGIPTPIEAPVESFNDTETMIFGASHIIDIGDLADKYARSIDISKAKNLRRLSAGFRDAVGDERPYNNQALTKVNTRGCSMLQELYLRNCAGLTETLDLASNKIIEKVDLVGTRITGVTFPSQGNLKEVKLPRTLKTLVLDGHPKLINFELIPNNLGGGKYEYTSLTALSVINCPINTADLIANAPNLQNVRVFGITDDEIHPYSWRFNNADLLVKIMNLHGFDNNADSNGNVSASDVLPAELRGTCFVKQIPEYLYNKLMMFFNDAKSMAEVEEKEKNGDLVFNIKYLTKISTFTFRFFNEYTNESLPKDTLGNPHFYSQQVDVGLLDDQIEEGSYLNREISNFNIDNFKKLFTRTSDYRYSYECTGFGFKNDKGEIIETDITNFKATLDMDFYAIYGDAGKIPKQYKFEFYTQIDNGAGMYGGSPTVASKMLTYPATYTVPDKLVPSEYTPANADHIIRFRGWKENIDDEIGTIAKNFTFRLTDDMVPDSMLENKLYVFDYYSDYETAYKHPVTFLSYDNQVLHTDIYYVGAPVYPYTDIKAGMWRDPDNQWIYTFTGWQPVDKNGNKIAGTTIITDTMLKNTNLGTSGYYLGSVGMAEGRAHYLKATFSTKTRKKKITYIVNNVSYPGYESNYSAADPAYTGGSKPPVVPNISNVRTVKWTDDWDIVSDISDASTGYHREIVKRKIWEVEEWPTLSYYSLYNGTVPAGLYSATTSGTYDIRNIHDGNYTNSGRFRQASGITTARGKSTVTFNMAFAQAIDAARPEYSDFATNLSVSSIKLMEIKGNRDGTTKADWPVNGYAGTELNAAINSSEYTVLSTLSYASIYSTGNKSSIENSPIDLNDKSVSITRLTSVNAKPLSSIKSYYGSHCRLYLEGCNLYIDDFKVKATFRYTY